MALILEYNRPSRARFTSCLLVADHLGSTRAGFGADGTIKALHE